MPLSSAAQRLRRAYRGPGSGGCSAAERRLIGLLQSSRRHSPTRFYLSFTKGLRPFNSEAQWRVYSVGGPGSTVVFLSQLPESLGLAAGLFPLRLLLGLPVLSSVLTPT